MSRPAPTTIASAPRIGGSVSVSHEGVSCSPPENARASPTTTATVTRAMTYWIHTGSLWRSTRRYGPGPSGMEPIKPPRGARVRFVFGIRHPCFRWIVVRRRRASRRLTVAAATWVDRGVSELDRDVEDVEQSEVSFAPPAFGSAPESAAASGAGIAAPARAGRPPPLTPPTALALQRSAGNRKVTVGLLGG